MRIRPETPLDLEAIREVNRLAFGREEEAEIVDRLRADGLVIASLVAEGNGGIAGHILFSRLPVETPAGTLAAASLAPMAVRPGCQRQGIGSALVRAGLEACRSAGLPAVIVVGHPGYYPRFGFSARLAQTLRGPFRGPAWMALELTPGALSGIEGVVRYPAAFRLAE